MSQLTQGQKLVDLNFNPSGDDKVTRFKQKIAEAIDIICEEQNNYSSSIKESFVTQCVDKLIIAQMLGVKSITWKD